MKIVPLRPEEVPLEWPRVSGWITNACHRTGDVESTDELHERCKAGADLLVLIGDTAACVMSIADGFLHITSLGGRDFLRHVPDLLPAWQKMAELVGCNGVSLKGRRGWERVLKPYGFELNNGFLEKTSWV